MPAPVVSHDGGAVVVAGRFDDSEGQHPFTARLEGAQSSPDALACGNAMLCLGLTPAIANGADLHIEAPVSRLLLHQSETIRDIFARWYPDRARRIEITASEFVEDEPSPAPGTASFFTGGVDSLYTLRERDDDALVYVQGYELTHGDTRTIDPARNAASRAAEMTGKRFIEVTTDARVYLDKHTNWLTEANGASLAAVGHLLAGELGIVVISSSSSFERLLPLGCDPLIDPLWGSGAMRVVTFGCQSDRPQKLEAIADWDVAQQTLRVCAEPDFEIANCGRCEKCVRTFGGLVALGAVDAYAKRFEGVPTMGDIREMEIHLTRATSWFDWLALGEFLEGRELKPKQAALQAILGERLHERSRIKLNQKMRPYMDKVIDCPHWKARWPKFRRKVLRSISESDPDWQKTRVRKHLPELRGAILDKLSADPVWLKKKIRRAGWQRLRRKLGLGRD